MKDYYKILEVHPDASPEVMNNAYRVLVRKYHPDLYHGSDKRLMEERMQAINEAYNVLSNPRSRAEFDCRYRRDGSHHGGQPETPSGSLRGESATGKIKRLLLWGLASFVFFRFLLAPILASPVLKVALLILLGLLALGFLARARRL